MLITKTIEIDMGHRIPNHKSKCRNIHGHRYKIEVGIDDKVRDQQGESDEGMVIDYSDLKEVMMEMIDANFDHGFVIYSKDDFADDFEIMKQRGKLKVIFVDFIPTAENLAKYWYYILEDALIEKNIQLAYVRVFETPTSTATYSLTNK